MCPALDSRVDASLARAAEALFAAQRADGSWPNPRPPAVLGTAGAVAALHTADRDRSADLVARGRRWLLDAQNADGGWGGVAGAATQLVPTVIAAACLHLSDPDESREPVRRALAVVESHGGMAAFTDPGMAHMAASFLGLAGLGDARGARRVPLEVLLLPRPLWRKLLSFRVVPFIGMAFIQDRLRGPLGRWARAVGLRTLADVERRESRPGGYGGDNWLAAVVCLGLVGAQAPPEMTAGTVDFLRANARPDGSWHIMQGLDLIGGSYVARGLADAGHTDDPRLARARQWLSDCRQVLDMPAFGAPAGGWGWEGPRGWPNTLDSANVLSALAASGTDRRGVDWLLARQDRRGSWSTFVADTRLPNDGPCPYGTAQSVEALLDSGVPRDDPRVRKALAWLLTRQRPDGTFDAVWYRGRAPGTGMVLVALARAGLADHPVTRRARDALLRLQLADGSWGPGALAALGDDRSAGTVEDTSWALRGLVAAGLPADDPAARRAADRITSAQRPDGLWEPSPVCTYIRDFAYYVDGLIVNGLALKALAAYRAAVAEGAG